MSSKSHEIAPFKQEDEWTISRKSFVKTCLLSGIALQLPFLHACGSSNEDVGDTSPLSNAQFLTVRALQNVLFPDDGNGPGAQQINADRYFVWMLNDAHTDPDDKTYFTEKLERFCAECKEKCGSPFEELTTEEQIAFIDSTISDWSEKWISRMLTIIFEALLLNPIYGVNTNEVGWQWLNHDPGMPRPTATTKFPELKERAYEL